MEVFTELKLTTKTLRRDETMEATEGRSGICAPMANLDLNHPTLVILEEKCKTRRQFKEILAQMVRLHLTHQTFAMSRILYFSSISYSENLHMATTLFHHFDFQPNLFIFNIMIKGLSFAHSRKSLSLYRRMLRWGVLPDSHTFNHLLKACIRLAEAKMVHQQAVVCGLSSSSTYLQNSLVKVYMEHGGLIAAREVFGKIPHKDVVSWNVLIGGYVKAGKSDQGLNLFQCMCSEGVAPDDFTMVGILGACGKLADFRRGRSIHAKLMRTHINVSGNPVLCNAILDMYVKCRELDYARKVFNRTESGRDIVSWNTLIAGYAKMGQMDIAKGLFGEMPSRDIVAWNSIINGYVQKGEMTHVMQLFGEMQAENVKPDERTLLSLVSAIGKIGNLDRGKWIHGLLDESGTKLDAFLGSAIIDMYCKCGSIDSALSVFEQVKERDVSVWTAMISGLARHGNGSKAVELFQMMLDEGVEPNHVTFIGVLTACSHCGMLREGLKIFRSMGKQFGIKPGVQHYGCLVDLLGRAGRLAEAKDLIEKMPMKPSRSIWGALLNACRVHQDVELAEIASRELLKLEPEGGGGYVLMSNLYCSVGRREDADNMRQVMDQRGLGKIAGHSRAVC